MTNEHVLQREVDVWNRVTVCYCAVLRAAAAAGTSAPLTYLCPIVKWREKMGGKGLLVSARGSLVAYERPVLLLTE